MTVTTDSSKAAAPFPISLVVRESILQKEKPLNYYYSVEIILFRYQFVYHLQCSAPTNPSFCDFTLGIIYGVEQAGLGRSFEFHTAK